MLHYDESGPEPELHRLYLHPQAIGTGAGSALISALHDCLARGECYALLVAASNARAIAVYERDRFRCAAVPRLHRGAPARMIRRRAESIASVRPA